MVIVYCICRDTFHTLTYQNNKFEIIYVIMLYFLAVRISHILLFAFRLDTKFMSTAASAVWGPVCSYIACASRQDRNNRRDPCKLQNCENITLLLRNCPAHLKNTGTRLIYSVALMHDGIYKDRDTQKANWMIIYLLLNELLSFFSRGGLWLVVNNWKLRNMNRTYINLTAAC